MAENTPPTIPDGNTFADLTRAVNGLAIEAARSTAVTTTRMDSLEKSIAEMTRLFSEVSGLKTLVEVLKTQTEMLRAQAQENKTNIAVLAETVTTHQEVRRDYEIWRKDTEVQVTNLERRDAEQDKKLIVLMTALSVIVFLFQVLVSVWIAPALQKVFGT